MEKVVEIKSAEAMQDFAARIGKALKGDETFGLSGDLGAGKTQFTKGLARGFGIGANVISPTFVLERVYQDLPRKKRMHHLDAYRISEAEILGLGIADQLDRVVTVVEWADRVVRVLPDDTIWIQIKITGDTKRRVEIHYHENREYLFADQK